MKKILLVSTMMSSALSFSALANGLYAGVSYSFMDLDAEFISRSATADISSVNLVVGHKFHTNFAVEGFYSFGVSQDSFDREINSNVVASSRFEIEMDSGYGVNLIGLYPISDKFDVYAKIGYADFSFDDTDSDEAGASGASFGVGANYKFGDNHRFFLEYINYADGEYDDFDIQLDPSSINAGYSISF